MIVFLGSTFSDLQAHRAKTIDALRALAVHVDAMELWLARPDDPLTACLDRVRRCDVYICIVAHRYGSETPEGKSYTHAEYEVAQREGKACLVFLMDDEWPVLPKFVDRGQAAEKLDKFKQVLRERHLVTTFTSARDLAYKVVESVKELLEDRKVPRAAAIDLDKFWKEVEAQWSQLDPPDLRVEFDREADPLVLMNVLSEQLKRVADFHEAISNSYACLERDLIDLLGRIGCDTKALEDVPHYENPFINRDWELITFFPNCLRRCEVALAQLRVKYLETLRQTGSWGPEHEQVLEEAKEELRGAISRGILID